VSAVVHVYNLTETISAQTQETFAQARERTCVNGSEKHLQYAPLCTECDCLASVTLQIKILWFVYQLNTSY
jgi:hypothetical protein